VSTIHLIGGPADGREVTWNYEGSQRLQMPIFGPDGLSFGNYLQDPDNPSRFVYGGMEKPEWSAAE